MFIKPIRVYKCKCLKEHGKSVTRKITIDAKEKKNKEKSCFEYCTFTLWQPLGTHKVTEIED